MNNQLEILANLEATSSDRHIRLTGSGQSCQLVLSEISLAQAVKHGYSFFYKNFGKIKVLQEKLHSTGLTLDLKVGDNIWVTVGKNARPGFLSKIFYKGFEVKFATILKQLAKLN